MQKIAYIRINYEIIRCYISFRICQEARPINHISAIIKLMNYNNNH